MYEVDISGRLEILEKDSVLALAGKDFHFSVKLSAQTKAKLKEMIEEHEQQKQKATGKKKRKPIERDKRVFAIMLFYLLANCPNNVTYITLDHDYDKKSMGRIKGVAQTLLKREKDRPRNLSLVVGSAGKGQAHRIAIETYRGNRNASLILLAEQSISSNFRG